MGTLDKNRSKPRKLSVLNAMLESNGKSHIIKIMRSHRTL
jgi:hypothetical protein